MMQAAEPVNLINENSITIEAACRLHLGLMEICAQEPNLFGGIGIMAEQPFTQIEGVVGTASKSQELDIVADAYWKSRIANLCERWKSICNETHLPLKQIVLKKSAPPHCGLGSGTQVACAVTAILERARGRIISSTEDLKSLTGRGARSCVGLQGFMEGGFIVDYGHCNATKRRSLRLDFPSDWQLLLVRVSTSVGDSGEAEQQMFNQCASHPNTNRERMLELIETEIVPAVQTQDWDRWDHSVGQYGYYAGKIFSECQGGIYRTPEIGRLVEMLAKLGCLGAAQSSWGPTVLIVAKDREHAMWLSDAIKIEFPNALLEWTSPQNNPARLLLK
jgi:beta-RFAP synthase